MHGLSVFLVLLAGTSWGTSGFFATTLRELGFDSLQLSLIRNFVSAVILIAFCLICRRRKMKIPFKNLLLIALSGVGLYSTGAFYYAAMNAASISVAVVLMYLAPVIVMIYSVIFMGERVTYKKLICILTTLVGTALVTGIAGGVKVSFAGIILGVMSGLSYSLYNICVKYEVKRGDDPFVCATYCFVFATLVAVVFASPVKTASLAFSDLSCTLVLVILLGLVTSALPYIVYTYAMKYLPAGIATSLGCVEPLVATLIGVLLFNETMTALTGLGIVLIVGSVAVISMIKE